MLYVPEIAGELILFRPFGIARPAEVGKQALLHPEHRIGIDVGIVGVEDMRWSASRSRRP